MARPATPVTPLPILPTSDDAGRNGIINAKTKARKYIRDIDRKFGRGDTRADRSDLELNGASLTSEESCSKGTVAPSRVGRS